MLRLLAVVARLVAPAQGGDVTVTDVESSAITAAEWFADVRLLPRAQTRALDSALRSCGTDNACVAAALDDRAIDEVLYVVASLESGFATAELIARSGTLVTQAIEIDQAGDVDRAVDEAVTRALEAGRHRRGTRVSINARPSSALIRIGTSTVAAGEPTLVASGRQELDASAPGFITERRSLELQPGTELALHLELSAEKSAFDSWWLWTGLGVLAAAAVVVPIIATSSGDSGGLCYGTSRDLCGR